MNDSIADDLFVNRLNCLFDDIIDEFDLPDRSIKLITNFSSLDKGDKKETSKTICICEPEYPPIKNSVQTQNATIMNIRANSNSKIELLISNSYYHKFEVPKTAFVKDLDSDKSFKHVVFSKTDNSIYNYIHEIIVYNIKNYQPTANFGCCSRFEKCSDSLKCVHENKLYSRGCQYRRNLEANKIFFGKNKNI